MRFIRLFYQTATESIGLPLEEDSQAIDMFRVVLYEHQELYKRLKEIEDIADSFLQGNNDYKKMLTLPGIGPILALMILSETGD